MVIGTHTAGWVIHGNKRSCFYGIGVPADCDGAVPQDFEVVDVPGNYYELVGHPSFDYPADDSWVMQQVGRIAFEQDCAVHGFKWRHAGHCYQQHCP